MEKDRNGQRSIVVDKNLVHKVRLAIDAALAYEAATGGRRKLGITGEVGEILACYHRGLRLMLDNLSMGYDALDRDGKRVQIKTRRSESEDLPKGSSRVSRFSDHEFDYALLVLLDRQYNVSQIWKAERSKLEPVIGKQKRRNPSISLFWKQGHQVFPE